MLKPTLIASSVALLFSASSLAAEHNVKELLDVVKQQQALLEQQNQTIEQLSKRVEAVAQQADDNQQAVEATVEAVESAGSANNLHIGGYGELHYNNLSGKGGASDKDQIDFHRFVLFAGYDYSDKLRFRSELELEHSLAGEGKEGEVELEQAYIDYDFAANHTARAGLFLLPVGLLNQTHEPDTFYGTERNNVEKNILPTTWWEAGGGVLGELSPGVKYEAYIHSGLNTNAGKKYAIRSGRQKVAEAEASDLAATVALSWSGVPGLTLGTTLQYQQDITQGNDADAGSATLIDLHGEWQSGDFAVRALYAQWDLDGAGPESVGADSQRGWYIEPSYRLNESFGVFTRYSSWDNQAGDDSIQSEKSQWDLGVNWWLHKHVVIKADYQSQDNDNGKEQSGINLGVGYQF